MMNKNKLLVFVAFAVLAAAALACEFSASTANIKDAWMASDEAGQVRTDVFTQDAIFYCNVDLANAPDDTTVKASWTAVEVEGEEPNVFLDETELTGGDNNLTFQLSNSSLWPLGSYKVDLYLNDELDRTLEFEVQ
jgi:hypothetical protein